MNIQDMEYFLAIVEEGSITAAAKRLHIAQPPLSRQMKQLETQLGVQLFERGRRRVKVTEAGNLLRHRAEQILELTTNTIKELKEFETGLRGTLSIGAVTSSWVTLLPDLIRVFRDRYPHVLFRLREGESRRITELLDKGIVDIGMVRVPFDTEIYESIELPHEPLVIAFKAGNSNSLDGDSPEISLAELAGKPLMIHRKYEKMLTEHCQQAGFAPEILCESDDVLPLLAWAAADIGIAVVPRSAVSLVPSANLVTKAIVNPALETAAALIWVRNRFLSTTARHFLSLFASMKV
ncbi:LysR family transcriptional regulator [Sporomusa malonica]|uniref:Transcriptional regulator, LysR family n=1 Tax=Sporomusa malonica TaxID=112901 RepID=A0A1W2EZR0_9FIRM|nr:LysR family transcriptional regulator [Sporomusa malonica]SMD14696.1 transcriptional regulator, LysR family [Sporomusa malonica]